MTPDTVNLIGRVSLGVYALLLGVGGSLGYFRKGSKASLYAGILSALFALIALGVSSGSSSLGFWFGLVLAVLLTTTFLARFINRGKFMPSGMLCLVSIGMVVLLFWVITQQK